MPPRPELGQRKRPKYTRSKTGCLTCRVKKIKVRHPRLSRHPCPHHPPVRRDQAQLYALHARLPRRNFSPSCHRLIAHTAPQCSWPEGVPARKKSISRRDDVDGRPSTAGSSGLSDASTPPGRELTPPRRSHDISLLPMPSRAPR